MWGIGAFVRVDGWDGWLLVPRFSGEVIGDANGNDLRVETAVRKAGPLLELILAADSYSGFLDGV
jgi:hypothetical protein